LAQYTNAVASRSHDDHAGACGRCGCGTFVDGDGNSGSNAIVAIGHSIGVTRGIGSDHSGYTDRTIW
jgi:hypothetical protein